MCVCRYECTANSVNGEDTAAGQLIVKSKTTIIDGPVDRTETLDETIVMKCEVVADLSLDLDVTWKKDNLDFGQPGFEKNERIHQDGDHSLTIKNLTFEDSGMLECFLYALLSQFAKMIHYKFKQKVKRNQTSDQENFKSRPQ